MDRALQRNCFKILSHERVKQKGAVSSPPGRVVYQLEAGNSKLTIVASQRNGRIKRGGEVHLPTAATQQFF